jgi:hypothetical protein
MGVSLLGGHPETAFHIWVVFSAYFLARILLHQSPIKDKWGKFVTFFGAGIFGILVGGIQLVPFLDFMLQSSTFAQGGRSMVERGSNLFYSQGWTTYLATAITLICPAFFGNPVNTAIIPGPLRICKTTMSNRYTLDRSR